MVGSYEEVVKKVQGMSEEEIDTLLKSFHSSFTYSKIKEALSLTMNDLSVGDLIFATDKIESSDPWYSKFTIDVIVYEIASRETFKGLHYGLWVEQYDDIKGKDLDQEIELLRIFIKSANAFKVDNFDTILLNIEDGPIVFEAMIDVIERSSKKQDYFKDGLELFNDWMKQFRFMIEAIEEQLILVVMPICVRLNFKEAQRLVARALDITDQKGEWILEYLSLVNSYQKDSFRTAYKRVQSYLVKSDPCYKDVADFVKKVMN